MKTKRRVTKAVMAILAMLPSLVLAQGISAEGAVTIDVLARTEIQDLPSTATGPAEWWLMHITLPPRMVIPGEADLNMSVLLVERGDLTLRTTQQIAVNGQRDGATAVAGMYEVTIPEGGFAVVPPEVGGDLGNLTDGPVVVLISLLAPSLGEVEGGEDAPQPSAEATIQSDIDDAIAAGFSQEIVAIGHPFLLPPAPVELRIERVILPVGAKATTGVVGGAELAGVVLGKCALTAGPKGIDEIWPLGVGEAAGGRTSANPGETVELSAGSFYLVPVGSTGTIRTTGEVRSVLLRVVIVPV